MKKIPKIKALVPMKQHSERVPNKNIRLLSGRPVCHWVLDALSNSKYIDEIIINTDSDEIASICSETFDVNILKRPDFLVGDMIGIQPLISHDLSNTDGEFYLQTHSTNPLLTTETIDKAIEAFFNQSEHDALFSVNEIKHRYYWPNGTGVNHDPKNLLRTQDLNPIYFENSCLYIFSKETNNKVRNRLGSNPMMFEMKLLESVDIDEIEDFYWAEHLLNRKQALESLIKV
jgi:CMP-N-acetylneuraminic acid synthetase